jgi:hypothetical protein
MTFVDTLYVARIAMAASLAMVLSLSCAYASPVADDAEAQAQEAWRESIAQSDVQAEGCLYATYPSTEWLKVPCAEPKAVPAAPRIRAASRGIVGDGTDYSAAVSSGLISRTMGSFPIFTSTGEEDGGSANDYTLQLNTNSQDCPGNPANCSAFVQFFYGPGEGFFQYWLIGWPTTCPSGWGTYPYDTSDCYRTSPTVSVPAEPVSSVLETVKLSASAKAGGQDRLIVTIGTEAYTTSMKEAQLKLAPNWTESEFNIFGGCCGSEAVFNSGTSIRVKVGVTNGTTNAPICESNGLTLEYSNLTLGKKCTAVGGTAPYIVFNESN